MVRAIVLAVALVCSATVACAETLVIKESRLGVKETIDALARALEEKGVKIMARVDHAANAKSVGMELRPTELLIFGNPKLGTPLMQSSQRIGIDLPMKALAWQDADGKVFLGYTAPETLRERYGISDRDEVLATMAKALENFASAATGAGR